MEKIRCQSCGMPLTTPGYFGTNADKSENRGYCMYCFQGGKFTLPGLTLKDMINRSVDFMTKNLNFTEERARGMSEGVIPRLKRWK